MNYSSRSYSLVPFSRRIVATPSPSYRPSYSAPDLCAHTFSRPVRTLRVRRGHRRGRLSVREAPLLMDESMRGVQTGAYGSGGLTAITSASSGSPSDFEAKIGWKTITSRGTRSRRCRIRARGCACREDRSGADGVAQEGMLLVQVHLP